MSRKNRKPIYTLSQDEAERLIAEVKNSVEKLFVMPAAGERNAEFHVLGDDGEKFTIGRVQGRDQQPTATPCPLESHGSACPAAAHA